jgi:hypothetical protein
MKPKTELSNISRLRAFWALRGLCYDARLVSITGHHGLIGGGLEWLNSRG